MRRHARGRITKSVRKKEREDVVIVASEIMRFWRVYDKEGIWRGDIEVNGLFWLFAVGLFLDMVQAQGHGGVKGRRYSRTRSGEVSR